MTLLDAFMRVSKVRRCPICEKPDWCLVSRDDPSNPSTAICARIPSPVRWSDAGWLHRLRDEHPTRPRCRTRTFKLATNQPQTKPFDVLAQEYKTALIDADLQGLADNLEISTTSLRQLGIGWCGWGFAFPMLDADGAVRGIRVRRRDATKLAVSGSRDGLFIPATLPDRGLHRLLVCEGPTDTAALLDLGFSAVGRPSCLGGTQLIVQLARGRSVDEVVIVADIDSAGQHGAQILLSALLPHVRLLRVVTPPAGIKDARAWKQAGASSEEIQDVIDAAQPVCISLS